MKAAIILTDIGPSSPSGGFDLRCEYEGPRQSNDTCFNPNSPAHQAARVMIKHLETQGEQRGQVVVKTTDEIVEMAEDAKQVRRELVCCVYEWLGTYRMQLPVDAIGSLQNILGPLPTRNVINLDAVPLPRDATINQGGQSC
jgi:hypothetical protein